MRWKIWISAALIGLIIGGCATAVAPSWNYVDLCIVARGGLNLTDALRAALVQYFETRRPLTTFVNVREPVYVSIDVTIDDPKAYSRPWNVQLSWSLQPDIELIESICEENNKDLPHMVGK